MTDDRFSEDAAEEVDFDNVTIPLVSSGSMLARVPNEATVINDRWNKDAEVIDVRNQLVADWRDAGGECSWHDDCEGFGCRGCLRAYERSKVAVEPIVAPGPPVATPAVEHNRKVAAALALTEANFPFDPKLTRYDIAKLHGLEKLRGVPCRATAQCILELHVSLMSVPTPDQRRV